MVTEQLIRAFVFIFPFCLSFNPKFKSVGFLLRLYWLVFVENSKYMSYRNMVYCYSQVLKLHTKLGKPIPSTDPVVIAASAASSATTAKASTVAATKVATATTVKKVLATPKITFVGKRSFH